MLIKESVDKSTDFIPDGMTAFERNVKRIGDCLLAFIALVVFSPLFLICYIAVRREDGCHFQAGADWPFRPSVSYL